MNGKAYIFVLFLPAVILFYAGNLDAEDLWQAPIDTAAGEHSYIDTAFTLEDALKLVGAENSLFQSYKFRSLAARENIRQAGLWPNPELEAEFEEFGWDAPGFRESEFALVLAQEFELFGQRGARKRAAGAEADAEDLRIRFSAFDLYLETKQRFYQFAHAQHNVALSGQTVVLASEIVDNIKYRLEKGASLQSELLLAELQLQRSKLALDQAKQDMTVAETALVSLWKGQASDLQVLTDQEPDHSKLTGKLDLLLSKIDSSRQLLHMQNEAQILRAQRDLAGANAYPPITLKGGFKRFEGDNSKAFLFGVSLPLPLFNRNQGEKQHFQARLRSMEFEIEQSRIETRSFITAHIIKLKKIIDRHAVLDSLILPSAREAYLNLEAAYEAGRLPYTQLLEAEKTLNDLNFEHNDVLLAIRKQVIQLESLTGFKLSMEEAN